MENKNKHTLFKKVGRITLSNNRRGIMIFIDGMVRRYTANRKALEQLLDEKTNYIDIVVLPDSESD